ncbi:MAG: bifunctional non-ous end joining protein LigD [Chloroflexota bacterium]|nr:bifunctional non-ous end joining protein LigD [Chloroflexota bacterium]
MSVQATLSRMPRTESETLTLDGHEVTISNPGKIFFADAGITKSDLVHYYLAVADGAVLGVRDRPMALKRFVDGAAGQAFFQKRAPKSVPEFVRTVELSFPSGRTADEVVVDNSAALAWVVNLGCIDLNPHPVRSGDLDHPDELRVDLDPGPGVSWADVRSVALVVREVLEELGYTAWPKTSGSRGIHVYVRISPEWAFGDVRRAALALAREVERRAPSLATS